MSKEDSAATGIRLSPGRPGRRNRDAEVPCQFRYPSQCPFFGTARGRLPEWPKGAVCKTVGSAYDGSNPSPATTCENGPLAGDTPALRAVACCVILGHQPSADVAAPR